MSPPNGYLADGIPETHDPKLDSEFGYFRQKIIDHHLNRIKKSARRLAPERYKALFT